jgi:hypothetical protein
MLAAAEGGSGWETHAAARYRKGPCLMDERQKLFECSAFDASKMMSYNDLMPTEVSKAYCLHLGLNECPGATPTYSMTRTAAPSEGTNGGAYSTVHYSSWDMLWAALVYVGVPDGMIEEIDKELKEKQTYILTGVWLTEKQLQALRFPDKI